MLLRGIGVLQLRVEQAVWPTISCFLLAQAQVDPSGLPDESNEGLQPNAGATADGTNDVSDKDSFDLDVELLASTAVSDEKAQRKADAITDDSNGDGDKEDSFELAVELENLRNATEKANDSDDDSDDNSDDNSGEDSFDLDVEKE